MRTISFYYAGGSFTVEVKKNRLEVFVNMPEISYIFDIDGDFVESNDEDITTLVMARYNDRDFERYDVRHWSLD